MEPSFRFCCDRGGTFTDIYCEMTGVSGTSHVCVKLLSEDPDHYPDAPTEGIRRILDKYSGVSHPQCEKVSSRFIDFIRMGTTVATNALLERKGERMALVASKGFRDLLHIGNQSRPKIFDLEIRRPELLYECVTEVDERVLVDSFSLLQPNATGSTGEPVQVMREPDMDQVRQDLQSILDKGIRSLAVVFLHSYTYQEHENRVGELAREMGFTHVSLSSELMPTVKIVPRGHTSCVDAYLAPIIHNYVRQFKSNFDQHFDERVRLTFMQSDGGLAPADSFTGFRAVLSGPAGGVVGYAKTTWDEDRKKPVIGFDMGGTSTDVSRFGGVYERVFENTTAGVTIQAPQLDINTVAAGGGSILQYSSGMFRVGPESAGAHPGPACYKKGGPLAITDANLVLGRLRKEEFPHIFGVTQDQPLDEQATRSKFEALAVEINKTHDESQHKTVEEVALGFVRVANEEMCRPIRALTQAKGYDTRKHILSCFGGAGGQHACSIARSLGIGEIFIHRFAGILSAFGMGLADVVHEVQEACALRYEVAQHDVLQARVDQLCEQARQALLSQEFKEDCIELQPYLNLRYDGTDTAMMIRVDQQLGTRNWGEEFVRRYQREYGFTLDKDIRVDDVRCRGVAVLEGLSEHGIQQAEEGYVPQAKSVVKCYFEGGWQETRVFDLLALPGNVKLEGPAIVLSGTSTILVEPRCLAEITPHGHIRIDVDHSGQQQLSTELDDIQLSIFGHRFMSIAEQMGRVLQRTSISANIKERLDFSCAIFDHTGGLVANAPHLPVHLGAMQEAVRFQLKFRHGDIHDGDVLCTNHPLAGGSHLPDITIITPVFSGGSIVFFVASRGHHGDIGGITPGSMPPFSKYLHEEGAAIRSFKLVENGKFNQDGIADILTEAGTRNLSENLSDLKAQVAANHKGIELCQELISGCGLPVVQAYMGYIQANAETAVRGMLKQVSLTQGLGEVDTLSAEDWMDDGTPIKLAVTIDRKDGSAVFDFAGTGAQVFGNCNAPPAVTYSAIIYCLRCMVNLSIPLNQGCLVPITVKVPPHSILSPDDGLAVVGGNVLTSQRVTDVVLKAFRACGASQGCMNNLTFGDDNFGYYETIAGGAGAGPSWHGQSGVHTHMTNTRITDPEILERRYPVYLKRFSLRPESGGAGRFRGGDGVVREIQALKPLSMGILSERRAFQPYGMNGGQPGARGVNIVVRQDGSEVSLGGKNVYMAQKGDTLCIRTPGGGGWGEGNEAGEDVQKAVAASLVGSTGSLGEFRAMQESA